VIRVEQLDFRDRGSDKGRGKEKRSFLKEHDQFTTDKPDLSGYQCTDKHSFKKLHILSTHLMQKSQKQ